MSINVKPRSDSLAANLSRLGIIDDFFAYLVAQSPSYDDMRAWLSERGVSTSIGALHNLISYHYGTWKYQQAIAAAKDSASDLPDVDPDTMKKRVAAMKCDLVMSTLTAQQQLAVWKLDQAERDLALRNMSMREAAVDALLKEAEGNEEAKEKLNEFLAALDAGKEAQHD